MKICGIIAEYNPFTNGHSLQIQRIKQLGNYNAIICVMSGNFVQRGEPAIMDKWCRTQMALNNGIDCVFELPVYFSTASAQYFASAGVDLLYRLGANAICFGSEINDVDLLYEIANYTNSKLLDQDIKPHLGVGISYAQALEKAISTRFGEIVLKSNDYLAIAYIKRILEMNYDIQALCIGREYCDYNDESIRADIQTSNVTKKYASATAIRKFLNKRSVNFEILSELIPDTCHQLIYNYPNFIDMRKVYDYFKMIFIRDYPNVTHIRQMNEGIENRIYEKLHNHDVEGFINDVITRRYPKNMINRLMINVLLGIEEIADVYESLDYARILGYNKNSDVLKEIKRHTQLFLISNLARDLKKYSKINPLINLDIKASKMYSVLNPICKFNMDFISKPLIYSEAADIN